MNIQSAMENFAEAWANANRQNYSAYSSSSEQHLLPQHDARDQRNDELSISISKHSPPFPSPSSQPGLGLNVSPYGVRSLPIRCMVQRSESDIGAVQLTNANTLLRDAFAILPSNMLFKDVIRAALLKLGFPSSESIGAKGFIQMRNWKPLPFASIADDINCTIEQMLGDVTSAATLVICLSKIPLEDVEWTDEAVRAAVFQLLKEVSQTILARISPLPQSMISNIVNAKYMATISSSTCQEFGLWYKEYRKHHEEPLMVSDTTCQNSRQTFHSTYELPLMRTWHNDCPNPSEDALKQYLNELNSSPIRQERGPISLQRLKMWWRNEKQRSERRASIAKLRQATAGSMVPLVDGAINPDGTPVRRPRKPRRRKSLKVLNLQQSNDPANVVPWNESHLSYANSGNNGSGSCISTNGNNGSGSCISTNENSMIDCRRDSFDVSSSHIGCSDNHERDIRGGDIGNIAGRGDPIRGGHSPSCNSDMLDHRGIPSRGGVEYSPGTGRDIIASTHAAVYSSIHVFNNMTNGGQRGEEEGSSGGIYPMHPTGNSPQDESSNHQRAIPLSLIRSTWN